MWNSRWSRLVATGVVVYAVAYWGWLTLGWLTPAVAAAFRARIAGIEFLPVNVGLIFVAAYAARRAPSAEVRRCMGLLAMARDGPRTRRGRSGRD